MAHNDFGFMSMDCGKTRDGTKLHRVHVHGLWKDEGWYKVTSGSCPWTMKAFFVGKAVFVKCQAGLS